MDITPCEEILDQELKRSAELEEKLAVLEHRMFDLTQEAIELRDENRQLRLDLKGK